MGRLYEAVSQIDEVIAARGLDPMKTKGEIGMKAGFFLALVFPDTPDDPEKLSKLRSVSKEMLGLELSM